MAKKKSVAIAPIDDLRNNLIQLQPQFAAALPPQMDPKRFIRVALTGLRENQKLVDCSRNSLFGAFMKCAQDGLLPDGEEAAIVPYKQEAKYMPMTRGILKKIRNSGELAFLEPDVVHENDKFRYWTDENGKHLMHEPNLDSDRGKPTHVYCIAKTKDGGNYVEVMTHDQVEKVRSMSRAKDGPWNSFWGEMAKKSVIRRLSKRLPMSTDVEIVIRRDDEDFDFNEPKQQVESSKPKSSRMDKVIEQAQVEEPPKEEEINSELANTSDEKVPI